MRTAVIAGGGDALPLGGGGPAGRPAVQAEEWDRLAGGRFYSSSAWLSFSGAEPGAHSGAAVHRVDGHLAGGVPVAELTAPPMPLYRWNDLLSSYGLPALPATGLLVGPRQGYQTHFLVAQDRPVTQTVAELVEEVRRRHARGPRDERACVAMYLTTPDALAAREAGVRAHPVLLAADAWLQVPSGGWAAWLDSLTRNRRVKVRKEARRFHEAGYRITHLPLSECYDRLGVAAASTLSKYGNSGRPEDYLPALRRYVDGMGDAARVSICSRDDGEPLGFCVYFVRGDTIFLRWAGFDHARLSGAAEYFNLLYYDQIARAPQLGARWIHAGIKSAEAKARRGARLRPLWLVDLAENSALARATDRIRQHNLRGYRRLAEDGRTAAALVDHDSWQAFL